MLLVPHDRKKMRKEFRSSCKLQMRIISCCPIPPSAMKKKSTFQQTFPSAELFLQELLLAFGNLLFTWVIFIFQKTNQIVTHVGWNNKDFNHFHFSGKVLQVAIIPSQSDITKVPGFSTASDRFWMLSRFSSELN